MRLRIRIIIVVYGESRQIFNPIIFVFVSGELGVTSETTESYQSNVISCAKKVREIRKYVQKNGGQAVILGHVTSLMSNNHLFFVLDNA